MYVNHVLRNIYVFFTLFGYWPRGWGGGGGSQMIATQLAFAVCHHGQLQKENFLNMFF